MLQWFANKRFMTGVQVLFGQRRDRNDQSAFDDRVQLSAQIRF